MFSKSPCVDQAGLKSTMQHKLAWQSSISAGCMCVYVCRSDDNFQTWFSAYTVWFSKNRTQVRLDSKRLHQLSYLACPRFRLLCYSVCQ